MTAAKPVRNLKTTAWVNSTYFAEGFPFIVVRYMASVFFTDMGVRERFLGFLNFLGIPWNLKFLWAPLLDYYSTKRRWMLVIEGTITACIALVAILSAAHLGIVHLPFVSSVAPGSTTILQIIVFVFVLLAFASATHDIAIDAYYLASLRDPANQALYTGDRVLSYRIAVIYVKSLLVAAAAWLGWSVSWALAAATIGLLCILQARFLPRPEVPTAREDKTFSELVKHLGQHFLTAFRTYLSQPRAWLILLFAIGYKLGDEIMFSMNSAFLLREIGVTKVQLSWLAGILGTVGAIAGSMASALWISRVGLKKAIWPLTLLMNVNIWAYVALAYWKPDPATTAGITWIAAIHCYEQIAAGLGNAVLITYLMRTCKPDFKAAHYALGSALMSVGSTVLGGFGGVIVEQVGYIGLYIIGFAAAIPAMLMIPFIPHLKDETTK